jgi:uncharacterized protein (TIGR02448 family)
MTRRLPVRHAVAPVLGLALVAATCAAHASSFAGTSAGTSAGGTSATSGSTSGDDKLVERAREDAAGFVASDGRIRTARLEAALRHLRAHDAAARDASDLQLARAILTR